MRGMDDMARSNDWNADIIKLRLQKTKTTLPLIWQTDEVTNKQSQVVWRVQISVLWKTRYAQIVSMQHPY